MSFFHGAIAALAFLTACSAPRPFGWEGRHREWNTWERSRSQVELHASPRPDAPLNELLTFVEQHNPSVEAAFQRWKAALERVPQLTALPEPRLNLAVYLNQVETRVGPMQGRVGLAQTFPWFGKLEAAGSQAFSLAEAAREEFEQTRLDVRHEFLDAWFEYGYLIQALSIEQGHLELLQHLLTVTSALYETGRAAQSSVIRLHVEIGKLEDRLQSIEDLQAPSMARMRAALGLYKQDLSELLLPDPKPSPAPELDQLLEDVRETSPVIRAWRHRIEAAEQGGVLAEKEFYPDFSLGADWTFIGPASTPGLSGSGDDALALNFGIELPIQVERYRAGEARAVANLAATTAGLRAAEQRLESEAEWVAYRLRDADRRLALYRDSLVFKSQESFDNLLVAYQTGEAGLDALVDAQRLLLEFQLAALRAATDAWQARAALERLTGALLIEGGES